MFGIPKSVKKSEVRTKSLPRLHAAQQAENENAAFQKQQKGEKRTTFPDQNNPGGGGGGCTEKILHRKQMSELPVVPMTSLPENHLGGPVNH